jgi:hypothetical protein
MINKHSLDLFFLMGTLLISIFFRKCQSSRYCVTKNNRNFSKVAYNKHMRSEIRPRIGMFFILVGFCLLMVFVFFILAGTFRLDFLLISLASLIIGSKLRSRGNSNPTGSRFQTIRRFTGRNKPNNDENNITESQDK